MYTMIRLYETDAQAHAAVDEFLAVGYSSDDIAMAHSPQSAAAHAEGEEDAPTTVAAVNNDRAVEMMGEHADFYLSRLSNGRSLVVATPPFTSSGKAESILDSHNPLPDAHQPGPGGFVPISEQAAPFSNMLGMSVLSKGTFFGSNVQEGTSHISRAITPTASNFTFSSMFGMKMLSKGGTPLSSMLGLPLSSNRGGNKPGWSGRATPFSSLLGLKTVGVSKTYLT